MAIKVEHMTRGNAADAPERDNGRLIARQLFLRPFPYRWEILAGPETLCLEFRGPTKASIGMAISITSIIAGFVLPWLTKGTFSDPFVVVFFFVGAAGLVLSIRRYVIPLRIVLHSSQRVADLSGTGWLAAGGNRFGLEQVWLEVRPIVIGPRHVLGCGKTGFVLLFRSPSNVIALIACRELGPVQAFLERIQAEVAMRVEVLDRSAVTSDL
ncbi:MAG: hypothetical protein IT434_07130 [Phycisphaerales bacterium]|jgi:hypothetical protein|nr:hypothetical protein [Phycisphaerales bacterium]